MKSKTPLKFKIVYHFYNLFAATFRVRYINDKTFGVHQRGSPNYIFAHWHENDVALVRAHRDLGLNILVSLSKDGDLMTYVTKRMGYVVHRGSSSRGGARGLINLIRSLKKGSSGVIAIDGPKGPRRKSKPGIVLLSQRTQLPILPASVYAPHRIVLKNSWSKMFIPLPFSKVYIIYGPEPIPPPEDNEVSKVECMETLEQDLQNSHRQLRKKIKKKI